MVQNKSTTNKHIFKHLTAFDHLLLVAFTFSSAQ